MAIFVAKSALDRRWMARNTARKYNHNHDDRGRFSTGDGEPWDAGTLNDPDKPMTREEEAAWRAQRNADDAKEVADYDRVPSAGGDGKDPEMDAAIQRYKAIDGYGINRGLRNGDLSPENAKAVEGLDRAFAQSAGPIIDYHTKEPKAGLVYRGIDGRVPLGHLKVGDVITDKGFVSTSNNRIFATEWVRDTDPTGKSGAVLKITIPKDTPVLRLKSPPDRNEGAFMIQMKDEGEVLLNRGTSFRITRMAPDRVIEAEVVR